VPKPGVDEHLGIGVLLEDAIAEVARLAPVTPESGYPRPAKAESVAVNASAAR
jgi:hypothetical protein